MGVGAGLYMYDVVVKMSTFAISSLAEFLLLPGTNRTSGRIFRIMVTINIKSSIRS